MLTGFSDKKKMAELEAHLAEASSVISDSEPEEEPSKVEGTNKLVEKGEMQKKESSSESSSSSSEDESSSESKESSGSSSEMSSDSESESNED